MNASASEALSATSGQQAAQADQMSTAAKEMLFQADAMKHSMTFFKLDATEVGTF